MPLFHLQVQILLGLALGRLIMLTARGGLVVIEADKPWVFGGGRRGRCWSAVLDSGA